MAGAATNNEARLVFGIGLLLALFCAYKGCMGCVEDGVKDDPLPTYTEEQALHVLVQRIRLSPAGVEAGLEPQSARQGQTFVRGCDAHREYGLEASIDAVEGVHVERIEMDYCFDKYDARIRAMNTLAQKFTVIFDEPLGSDRNSRP